MKNVKFIHELVILVVFASALGACTGGDGSTSTGESSSTGGSTNAGGGGSGGEGPVIDYPVCVDNTTAFVGALDGEPFDQIISSHHLGFDQGANPPTMSIPFDQSGKLVLHWEGLVDYTIPKTVYGTLTLPTQSKKRTVLQGSTMILQNNNYYKFNLFLDSGHLAACANVPP